MIPNNRIIKKILKCFISQTLSVLMLIGCSNQEKIKVGVISPFSGDGAIYGQHLKNGFTIALDKIKSENPEFAVKLEIIYEDDKLDSKEAVNAYNKLVNADKVKIIIGAFTSNTTLAIAPFTSRDKVLLITPTATNYRIKDAGDYVYRICPSDALQGSQLAEYAVNTLKAKKVSILFMNTDYGVGLTETFRKKFIELGGEIISSDGFPQNETQFQTLLIKIKKLNPDIIFIPSNWKEAANAVNQAKQLNIKKQILCTDGTFEKDFLELTKGSSEGVIITSFAWGEGPYKKQADEFKEKFKSKFGTDPGGYAALCYDALLVVSNVLMKTNYDVAKIQEALDSVEFVGATGLTKFNKFGEVNKTFKLFKVINNNFVPIN